MQSIHQRAPYDHMIFKGHTQNTSKFVYDMLYSAPSLPYRHPYVQVSIGYDILENGNSHWKLKKKNANTVILMGPRTAQYAHTYLNVRTDLSVQGQRCAYLF